MSQGCGGSRLIHPRATQGSRRVPTASCGSPMGTRRGQVPLPHVPGGSRAINQPGSGFLGLLRSKFLPGTSPSANSWGSGCSCAREGRGLHGGGDREQWPGGKGHSGPRAPSGLHHLRGGFWGHPAPSGGLWGLPLSVWHPRGAPHLGAGAVPTCQGPPCTHAPRNGARLWDFWGLQPHGRVFWIGGAIPRHPTPIPVASFTVLPPKCGADGLPVTSMCPPPGTEATSGCSVGTRTGNPAPKWLWGAPSPTPFS